jgi:tripartite-type tricarboxylate transporter receptor subunit TctC
MLRILVGFPPGGGTDAIARLIGEALKAELGATVVVENKAGAGGQLAAQALKAAAPDGNTVFISHDHTISILPLVSRTPGFEPAKDFVPVGGFASFVNAFAVSPGTPARTMDEYVAWVRGTGGGKGTVGVPAPASTPDFIENHRAGRLRVLAVLGRARQAALPEVPSFGEMGLTGFDDLPYYGFWAPAGTPAAAVEGFSQGLARAMAKPEVRERLGQLGLAVDVMNPAQLATREASYTRNWAEIIKRSGFQPQ